MGEDTSKKDAAPEAAKATPAPTGVTPTNGLAIAALVVGIIAFISGWAPFWGFLAGIAAVILGILGLKRPGLKGLSIAGIVTGGLGALWSLVVTAIFVIALVTVGIGGAALNTAIDQAQQGEQALVDAKKDFKKGETARFADFEVTVNKVTKGYEPENSFLGPSDGKEFIVVNLTVKNVADESAYVSSYDFDVNSDGLAVSSSFVNVEPEFENGTLSVGASVTGNIVYEVSKSASNLKLQYEHNAYVNSEFKELIYTLEI
jgi:hypothetical protein